MFTGSELELRSIFIGSCKGLGIDQVLLNISTEIEINQNFVIHKIDLIKMLALSFYKMLVQESIFCQISKLKRDLRYPYIFYRNFLGAKYW